MARDGRHRMQSRQHQAGDAGGRLEAVLEAYALCRYIEPLFAEDDQPNLPDHIEYDNDTSAYIPETFAYVIGRAIEELMKVPAGKAVQS